MSIEERINLVDKMVNDIEKYVQKGIWNPNKSGKAASEITKSDIMLNELMNGHSMKIDILTAEQIKLVSKLLKRLEQSKDKLPSPPRT